jgi:hypothetical protein
MYSNSECLSPIEILEKFPNLKREKLMYWTTKGYLKTKVETKGNRKYNYFYPEDLPKIERAYDLIIVRKMKDCEAFNIINKENNNQPTLFS